MASRLRSLGLAAVLGIAGCFPFKEEPLQTVQPGLSGSPAAVKTPFRPPQLAQATREEALRVDIVGQKLLTANRQTGVRCCFSALGAPTSGPATSELFHRNTDVVFITETLSRKCQTEAQLAAVLAYELGRMIVEREAMAAPETRRPERQPPMESRVGLDSGGTFGAADGVRQAELARYEKERPRRGAAPPPLPDPMALARGYLEKAGYATRDLDDVAPLIKEARANDTCERQLNGGEAGPCRTDLEYRKEPQDAKMPDRIPLIVTLDVEPDERTPDLATRAPWAGFEVLFEYVARIRPLLARTTGLPARFTWNLRLDPQIEKIYGSPDWVVQRYRRLLESLQAEGDEIGIHPHAWRWDATLDDWLSDYTDNRWIDHCLQTTLQTYQNAFGRRPRVSRFGDRFLSNRVIKLLDRAGILCDLTLEPGQPAIEGHRSTERTRGHIPDYSRVPHHPYRPSPWNYQQPGRFLKRRLWLIPLTTGCPLAPVPGLPGPMPECLTLLLGFPFLAVRQVFDLALASDDRPFPVAVARSDVLLNRHDGEEFKQFFDYLLDHPLRNRFVLETPPEALRRAA